MRSDQFERQARFTDQYRWALRPDTSMTDLTKEYVLSLHREVDEILDEVPWKPHRRYDETTDVVKSNVAEEIVDAMKFLAGLAHIWGITYEELCNEIDVKSDVVEDRWRQEHGETEFRNGTTPIALLDLDGVLCEYPEPFIRYVNDHNSGVDLSTMEKIEEWPQLKLRMKHEYRSSGIKRTLPAKPDSVVAAQMLKANGYAIVIMSQRPVEQYHRIYGDTLYWLRNNGVPYDRLIFVPSKQHKLMLAPYLPRIRFAVDDTPEVAVSLLNLGIRTYLLSETIRPALGAYTDSGGLGRVVSSMLKISEVQESQLAFRKDVRHGK